VADVPVLMSGGLISAVANHAALARLYDWALTFTREVVPAGGGAASIELLVGRQVSVTGAVTSRGGGKSFPRP
jgi:hypothetical protein